VRRQTNVEIGTSSQIHRQWRGWRSLACSRNNCDRKKSRGSNKTLAALMIPIKHLSDSFFGKLLTSAVIGTGAGAGVDSAWEQKNLEARKMLENAAESPASSARFVGLLFAIRQVLLLCISLQRNQWNSRYQFLYLHWLQEFLGLRAWLLP